MITDQIFGAASKILSQVGKDALHNQYPRDFEVYMCALELVGYDNHTVDYFSFPIMPKSITKTEAEATTIQTSFSGITVFNKSGFIPKELNIQGDFGRSLKLTSFEQDAFSKGYAYSMDMGYYTADDVNSGKSNKVKEFPFGIKTGYGCSKVLQSIIDKAKAHDPSGQTYKLFFYNPALGESYLVVPSKNPLTWSQNESTNMIWQYTLNLIAIANMSDVGGLYKNNKKSLQYSFGLDKVVRSLTSMKNIY